MPHVEGPCELTSWSEEQAPALDGALKVTVVRIGQRFSGGIEAETVADMVMTYLADGTAEFSGYQRVSGLIGTRSGTFVLRSAGRFDGTTATTHVEVVPGSGSGELVGLQCGGSWAAPSGSLGTYGFEVEFGSTGGPGPLV